MTWVLSTEDRFAREMRLRLAAIYKSVPSAAILAREFNLRCRTAEPITQETARKWLRGLSIPRPKRLAVLTDWLSLDHSKIWSGTAGDGERLNERNFYEHIMRMHPKQREHLINFVLSSSAKNY